MTYKKMKTLSMVDHVEVFWSSTEFRRYSIKLSGRGDPVFIYSNSKPTIRELREYIKDHRKDIV